MGFDVGFDAGSSAFEAIEAEECVGNELKIGWSMEGNEFAEKGNDRGGPGAAIVAAAGCDLKSLAVLEAASSKLVEAGFSYMEKLAGFCDSNATGIELIKSLQNELAWESAGELAFFIAPIDRMKLPMGTPDFRSLFGGVDPTSKNREGLTKERDPKWKKHKAGMRGATTANLRKTPWHSWRVARKSKRWPGI